MVGDGGGVRGGQSPNHIEFNCHSLPRKGPYEADQLTFEYLAYAALRHADLATIPRDLMT